MDYDPVKDKLGLWANRSTLLQRLFFSALGAVFLRNWYIRRALRGVFARANGKSLRVLDAGTGFGQHAYWIANKYPAATVHAVDIKEDYLTSARTLVSDRSLSDRVEFALDDLTDLRAQGPFDIIVSVDVMEHIEDDAGVFRNFARVLAPDGVVFITTPSDQGGSAVSHDSEESFIGEHVRDGYSVKEISEKLKTAGLTARDVAFTNGMWGTLAWRLLVKTPIQLLGRSFVFAIPLAVYYVFAFPVGMILNAMDLARPNRTGTGLLVTATLK